MDLIGIDPMTSSMPRNDYNRKMQAAQYLGTDQMGTKLQPSGQRADRVESAQVLLSDITTNPGF